jgi:Cu+-exporting ATPase
MNTTENNELRTATIAIKGMHCASCVLSVERALNKVAGAEGASVNLATQQAHVKIDRHVQRASLSKSIEDVGYEVTSVQLEGDEQDAHHLVHDHTMEESSDWLRKLRVKFWVALGFSSIVMAISILMMFAGFSWLHRPLTYYILFALTLPVILFSGQEFYRSAFRAMKHRTTNMDTLIAVGTLSAFVYSTIVTFGSRHAAGHMPDIYFDSATMIITLLLVGRWMEARAKQRTGQAIRGLLDLSPKMALRVNADGTEQSIPSADLQQGDLFIVKSGEAIATDGEVMVGESAVDESMMTGESIPVSKSPGASVFGATRVVSGLLRIRATRVGSETVLASIITTVQNAQAGKPKIQRLADKVSSVFVPIVLVIGLLTFLSWYLVRPDLGINFALMNMVAVLVIACPCALGLATPTAILVGTGRAAQLGMLFRNVESLEQLSTIRTTVFDKTGTLTNGKISVVDHVAIGSIQSSEMLTIAAALESGSDHPIAKAIVRQSDSVVLPQISQFQNHEGKGVSAQIAGKTAAVGNLRFMQEMKVSIPDDLSRWINGQIANANIVAIVSSDAIAIGALALTDTIRDDAATTIEQLKKRGIEPVMLTGDHHAAAEKIAQSLGISKVYAEALPIDKERIVRELRAAGRGVAMIGDGINDAPALAAADVGVAMHGAADIAKDTADVTLMSNHLITYMGAIELSHSTLETIKQNLFFAFFYNVIGIPIAAGLLIPWFGFQLDPMFAAAAMALSSISVVTNSLRLRNFSPMPS